MWTISQNILNQDSSLYLQDVKSNHNTGRFEALFCWLCQQSPTFFSTGTGFVEDNFSTDRWEYSLGMFQVHYIYCLYKILDREVNGIEPDDNCSQGFSYIGMSGLVGGTAIERFPHMPVAYFSSGQAVCTCGPHRSTPCWCSALHHFTMACPSIFVSTVFY